MSVPREEYVPPVGERWLRLARGFSSLAVGFLIGGYALKNLDPILSKNPSASFGRACASAMTYSRAEAVRVIPIVIGKLELRNVERQISATNLVISSDLAALGKRAEAPNRVGEDRANDMLVDGMGDRLMPEAVLKTLVAGIGISAEQANAVRYSLADDGFKRETADVLGNASDDVAFTANHANDWRLALSTLRKPAKTAVVDSTEEFREREARN